MLEPYEGKLSRTVLRRERGSNPSDLADSKATTENLKVIADLKAQGKSYRSIAKVLSESSGKHFSYSTVRYLYKKYIENGEQRN